MKEDELVTKIFEDIKDTTEKYSNAYWKCVK